MGKIGGVIREAGGQGDGCGSVTGRIEGGGVDGAAPAQVADAVSRREERLVRSGILEIVDEVAYLSHTRVRREKGRQK